MSNRPIPVSELVEFASALLAAGGVDPAEARLIAGSLVESNLRGHDSHGVVRVVEYVEAVADGSVRSGVDLKVVSETSAALVGDAQLGFGQVQCVRLIELLEPRARAQGIACGTLRNCGHVGRLGEWVERVAANGLAGLVAVNDNGVLKCVAPPGGIAARISTNPIAIGVPTADEPLVLDISTSAVANGKLKVAHLAGKQVSTGWIQDAQGNPTTDPAVRFTEPTGTILPMGGDQGYKGFGLGLVFDMLIGGLSGGWCPPAPDAALLTNNVLMMIWDPARFAGSEHFAHEAMKLAEYVRDTPRKPGAAAIRLPGDRANQLRAERVKSGVPIDAGTWNELVTLAKKLNVAAPL